MPSARFEELLKSHQPKGEGVPVVLLHHAITAGLENIVEWLLSVGVSPNSKDACGRTGLHKAAMAGKEHILSLLIQSGADVLCRDSSGQTPLHYAVRSGHVECTALLSEKMCEKGMALADHEGNTPIFYAATCSSSHTCLKKMLDAAQRCGADLFSLLMWKVSGQVVMTALHVAAVSGAAESVKTLLEYRSVVNVDQKLASDGNTALHASASQGHIAVIALLLEAGADLSITNRYRETPLHLAARRGHARALKLLLDKAPASLISCSDTSQFMPVLHEAAIGGHVECVRLLLEAGADPTIRVRDWTARSFALFYGHIQVSNVLAEALIDPKWRDKATEVAPSLQHGTRIKDERGESITSAGHQRPCRDSKQLHIRLGTHNRDGSYVSPLELYETQSMPMLSIDIVVTLLPSTKYVPRKLSGIGAAYAAPVTTPQSFTVAIPFWVEGGESKVSAAPVTGSEIVLTSNDSDDFTVQFDVQPSGFSSLIGRAVALSNQFHSTTDTITLPLFGAGLAPVGAVSLSFLMVKPWANSFKMVSQVKPFWKSTKIIGHRGGGATLAAPAGNHYRTHITENTVLSFVTAASLGAEYVEFDVQLTRDLVPVIFHDWFISANGMKVPLCNITFEEFKRLGSGCQQNLNTKRGSKTLPRSSSMEFRKDESEAFPPVQPHQDDKDIAIINTLSVLDKEYFSLGLAYADSVQNSCNTSLSTTPTAPPPPALPPSISKPFQFQGIYDHYTTLEETCICVPETTGFNVEIKYPSKEEQKLYGLNFPEPNVFVDKILDCLQQHAAGKRQLIFSSFDPDICLLLALKQSHYPVFLLTEAGTSLLRADPRRNSLYEAVRFAQSAQLLGIVSLTDPFCEAPELIDFVRSSGLLLLTYGRRNNNLNNVAIQKKRGVHAVIVDHVAHISKRLRQEK